MLKNLKLAVGTTTYIPEIEGVIPFQECDLDENTKELDAIITTIDNDANTIQELKAFQKTLPVYGINQQTYEWFLQNIYSKIEFLFELPAVENLSPTGKNKILAKQLYYAIEEMNQSLLQKIKTKITEWWKKFIAFIREWLQKLKHMFSSSEFIQKCRLMSRQKISDPKKSSASSSKNHIITDSFKKAVSSKDVLGLRIMMADSLLIDPSFSNFEEMYRLAKNVPGLFDPHDGQEFVNNKSLWNDDYMNKLLVQIVNNFSHERLDHLKEVIRTLRPVRSGNESLSSSELPYEVPSIKTFQTSIDVTKQYLNSLLELFTKNSPIDAIFEFHHKIDYNNALSELRKIEDSLDKNVEPLTVEDLWKNTQHDYLVIWDDYIKNIDKQYSKLANLFFRIDINSIISSIQDEEDIDTFFHNVHGNMHVLVNEMSRISSKLGKYFNLIILNIDYYIKNNPKNV